MVKLDKSKYTKSQWKVIKEHRREKKRQDKERREKAKKQIQIDNLK